MNVWGIIKDAKWRAPLALVLHYAREDADKWPFWPFSALCESSLQSNKKDLETHKAQKCKVQLICGFLWILELQYFELSFKCSSFTHFTSLLSSMNKMDKVERESILLLAPIFALWLLLCFRRLVLRFSRIFVRVPCIAFRPFRWLLCACLP